MCIVCLSAFILDGYLCAGIRSLTHTSQYLGLSCQVVTGRLLTLFITSVVMVTVFASLQKKENRNVQGFYCTYNKIASESKPIKSKTYVKEANTRLRFHSERKR